MKTKFSLVLNINVDAQIVSTIVTLGSHILKELQTMTTQADTIIADLAAAKASSDAANAKAAELIALTNSIKAKLDAALAAGSGMSATELQAIRDAISDLAVGDDTAKAATEAAITADTPAAPTTP